MQKLLDFEKLKYLYNAVPLVLMTHFVGALLFGLIMWKYVDGSALGIWESVMFVVLLFRLYHYVLYTNTSDSELRENSVLWLHRYYTYILIGGALWGSTAVLLFPQETILYQMVVVLFTLGVTSTAIGIISASWYLVVAYALFSFAPIIIRLAWMEDPLYQTIAYIVSALGILMIFTAKHFGAVIDNAIYNRFALSQTRMDLEHVKDRFFILLENAPVGIFYYDTALRMTDLNTRMQQILRRKYRDDMIGYDLANATDKRILPALRKILDKEEGKYEGAFYSSIAERSLYIELLAVPLISDKDEVEGAICFFKDLTAEMEAKEAIRQNAFYDPLTKLPNRILFTDRIRLAIEQSRRHTFRCAVLFIDLDHFKHINDQLGHYIGDQLLIKVSQRLLELVRSEDTVARIGGDEFLILLNALPYEKEEAKKVTLDIAEGLIDALKGDYSIEDRTFSISASIGAYIFSGEEEDDGSVIIKHADVAMYHAKRTGRNHTELYHEAFETSQQELLSMEREIRRALEENEFEVYYQPKVSVKSKSIAQVEALIRWNHPEKGLLLPEEFIPFAEENGLIIKVGGWVLEQCIHQIKTWQEDGPASAIESVAVNVSTNQFNQPDFVDYITSTLEANGIAPNMIELELTESVMLDNSLGAIDKIRELEAYGIRIALDDFGTGYSSLSYLKHLPVSIIKIDRSFISDIRLNSNSLMIVKTIVSIAKSLGMTVVAEGVESEEDLALLHELDCDYYQGYYCGEAVPARELEALLKQNSTVS